jgi:hypothetical protein
MQKTVTLEQVLPLIKDLPLLDKVRLIEQIAPQIERELWTARTKPRKSLRGLWRGLDLTEQDIEQARREMWSGFPRGDI